MGQGGAPTLTGAPRDPAPLATPGRLDAAVSDLDRHEAVRRLTVALRIGALLLGSGAATDEVEVTMRRVSRAYGLPDVQSAVTLGTIILSAFVRADDPPITEMLVVRDRASDYARLAEVAALSDLVLRGELEPRAALAELDRIEAAPLASNPPLVTLAGGLSAAASTVLFGGGPLESVATFILAVIVGPVVTWLERSRLPPLFQAFVAPFIVTILTTGLVASGVPIDGGIVVTGGILRFLPGAALAAGMRDLIDRSIISGAARLAEAILLGAGVGLGTAAALGLGRALAEASIAFGDVGVGPESRIVQVLAAAIACSAFATALGVPRRLLPGIAVVGGLAWFVHLAASLVTVQPLAPILAAAIVVGAVAQELARRHRLPAAIWTVPGMLPLLPGLLLVEGILAFGSVDGLLMVASAVGVGFALGAGVALGAILVAAVRHLRDDVIVAGVVQPVAAAIGSRIDTVTHGAAPGPDRRRRGRVGRRRNDRPG